MGVARTTTKPRYNLVVVVVAAAVIPPPLYGPIHVGVVLPVDRLSIVGKDPCGGCFGDNDHRSNGCCGEEDCHRDDSLVRRATDDDPLLCRGMVCFFFLVVSICAEQRVGVWSNVVPGSTLLI